MGTQRSRQAVTVEGISFSGRKIKWVPLFRRLVARLSGITGIGLAPSKTCLSLALTGSLPVELAEIRVGATGIECRLSLKKAQVRSPRLKPLIARGRTSKRMTHSALIQEPSDLDEELMSWIKAARIEARTSISRSS